MQNTDLQELVSGYLEQGNVMQLATVSGEQPWVCNVYFVYLNDRLYWLSFPERRHSQNIVENARVAATVMVKAERPTVGVQLAGTARIVEEADLVQKAMALYVEKYGEGQQFYENFIAKKNKHQMYELIPTEIVLFDEVNFSGDGRQTVL